MLELKRLLIFTEVAGCRSFSQAAANLHYSQSAVSHHILKLENDVGAQLFVRDSDGIYPTEVGAALLRHSQDILDRVREAEADLVQLVGGRVQVRLGAFATASATLVVEAVAHARTLSETISVGLTEAESAETLAALANRVIDIGIVFDDPLNPLSVSDAFEARYLLRDPMLLALPPSHRLAREPEITLDALRDEDWIEGAGPDTPCSRLLGSACRAAGFEPRVSFNSGDYSVVQELVRAGIGVALVPRLAFGHHVAKALTLRELHPNTPYRRISIVTRRPPGVTQPVRLMSSSLELACNVWAERLAEPIPFGVKRPLADETGQAA